MKKRRTIALPEGDPDGVRTPAFLSLGMVMVSWGMAPVFIRYLSDAYDPYSQAFIRFASATIALVAICFVWHRREFLRLFRESKVLFGLGMFIVFHQLLWTIGTYNATATMAQLIVTINVVFVIVFSFFLFQEERAVIRSPAYLIGTACSILGVAGVLARDPGSLQPVFDTGAVVLLITAVSWGVYKVWSKHIVMGLHPVPMFAVAAVYATFGLGVVMLVLGRPSTLVTADPRITAIAFVSGILPIGLAHPAYNYAQKHLGAAFSSSCNLIVPFLTYLFGMFILDDEALRATQWAGAAVLLAGAALVTYAGHRQRGTAGAASPPTGTRSDRRP